MHLSESRYPTESILEAVNRRRDSAATGHEGSQLVWLTGMMGA